MSVEQDPWLQQALRHAPDHDVAVPAAVRDTILTAARAAVRQPQPAQSPWWQRWLAPLMQPARLGYSGAFMALLVVGLWGLDQWDWPTVAPEHGPVLAVPAATTPASPGPAEAPVPAPRPEAPKTAATDTLAMKEASASRRPAVAAQAKAQAEVRASARAREVAPPSVVAAAEVAESQAPAAGIAAAAKPTPAAAPAPAPAAPAPVAVTGLDAPLAAAAPPAPVAAPAGLAAPRKMMKAPPVLDQAAANANQPLSPVDSLLAALHTVDRARWQTAQAQGVHGPAQDLWLGRLQLASAGLWRPAAVLPEGPPTVQWPGRDGGRLWLQPDGQVWLAWRNQAHGARLPEADAALLRAQLAEWH
ncbi:MAG: hypothetical protein IPJ08_10380 [Burkholderiales bacterium]|nr:hypothetical protein [Burkholderiales bacterium]